MYADLVAGDVAHHALQPFAAALTVRLQYGCFAGTVYQTTRGMDVECSVGTARACSTGLGVA